jgi:hypothetical protein
VILLRTWVLELLELCMTLLGMLLGLPRLQIVGGILQLCAALDWSGAPLDRGSGASMLASYWLLTDSLMQCSRSSVPPAQSGAARSVSC